jgi:thiosulfate dehydrogenase [quinone] large subunit
MQTSPAVPGRTTGAAASFTAADVVDLRLAYAILRMTTGMNMLMHGAVRIMGGVGGFAAGMVKNFAGTPLPDWFVRSFGLTLPFVELTLGAPLLLGIATRQVLVVLGVLMTILVFGTSLRGDWTAVGLQMTYALIFYVLLARRGDDAYRLGR